MMDLLKMKLTGMERKARCLKPIYSVNYLIMNLPCIWVSSFWLLLCLTVCTCRSTAVHGYDGQNVTLPCKYDSQYHGKCDICWMKGEIPFSGCGDEIIATDGDKVVRKTSYRYELNGELQKGDVSLTIINAGLNDSGKYGCRVHVPGLFNDKKYTITLSITQEPASTTEVNSSTPALNVTTDVLDHGISKEKHINASASESEKNIKETTDETFPVTVLSVLLILLIVVAAAVLMIWKIKRRNLMMAGIRMQNLNDSVIYSNSQINPGRQRAVLAVENIYNFEPENVYEQ